MGLARSTFYDAPLASVDGDELLARIGAICDEFECYGYRRVGAALRHQSVVVNEPMGNSVAITRTEHTAAALRRLATAGDCVCPGRRRAG